MITRDDLRTVLEFANAAERDYGSVDTQRESFGRLRAELARADSFGPNVEVVWTHAADPK